jgi:photosystem II stability/assembly factor-like uncharacterized protein
MKTTRNIFTLLTVFFILGVLRVSAQPVSLNEHNIKFENPTTATLVGQDGLIMRTENTGENWTVLNTGVTNLLMSNDFIEYTDNGENYKVHMAVGENGVILKSVDNGATWQLLTSGMLENLNDVALFNVNNINAIGIAAGSEYIAYVCGNNGVLLFSGDMGQTWTTIVTGTTENLRSISFVNDNSLHTNQVTTIVTGSNGIVMISKDFGKNWSSSTSGVTEQLNAVFSVGNDRYFAVGNNGTMISSNDAGDSWRVESTNIIENINDIKFLGDFTVGIAACDNGIMLRTTDGGLTWDIISVPTENDLYAVSFSTPDFGISVGENGTELYSADGGLTWVNREIEPTIALNQKNTGDIKLNQNYPNPFNPTTNISYVLPFNASVSVKIFDLAGREVRTLASGYQQQGAYSVNFDATNLSSGVYFYVLRANSGGNEMVKTMRMILTK